MFIPKKKNKEYAEQIDFPIIMNAGVSDPHVIANGINTYLLFMVRDDFNSNENAPVAKLISLSPKNKEAPTPKVYALVLFNHCIIHKHGTPNNEALNGHRLWKKGLTFYSWHKVHNSSWIEEIKTINSLHPRFDGYHWVNLNHYIITFHDETFECIANSYELITIDTLGTLFEKISNNSK